MNSSSQSLRSQYIETYSPEVVAVACRKANWHKARAAKLQRHEHFSAWQWLDLCEARHWLCAYCHQKAPLEPHHRVELHKGGANSIDNIEPVCRACHQSVHEWPDDVSDSWISHQHRLLHQFETVAAQGNLVRLSSATREENRARGQGVILELIAPARGALPLRGMLRKNRGEAPLAFINSWTQDWWDGRSRARVEWHGERVWQETVMLDHLLAVSEKVELFDAPQIPLMAPPSKTRRATAQMSFDL